MRPVLAPDRRLLGTIGGALGSVVEGDLEVRDAAYHFREDARTEASTREES